MINVTQQINAVRREVGRRVLEPGEARAVTISQTYHADINDVWDACTNPDASPAGSYPSPVICDCDFTAAISSRATRVEQSSVVTRPGALPPPGNTGVRSAGSRCGWGVNRATGLGLSSSTSLPSTINGGRISVPAPSASAGTWGWWDSPSNWYPERRRIARRVRAGSHLAKGRVHVTQQRTMVRGEHRRRGEPRGGTPSR
jgi:hypothetical protein